jgi:hypothetical protein
MLWGDAGRDQMFDRRLKKVPDTFTRVARCSGGIVTKSRGKRTPAPFAAAHGWAAWLSCLCELKCPNLHGTVSANRPAVELNTGATECRSDELDQLPRLRASPSVCRSNDGRNARFVVISPNLKDVFADCDFIVESAIDILVKTVSVLWPDIIESLFVCDCGHENARTPPRKFLPI